MDSYNPAFGTLRREKHAYEARLDYMFVCSLVCLTQSSRGAGISAWVRRKLLKFLGHQDLSGPGGSRVSVGAVTSEWMDSCIARSSATHTQPL